MGPTIVRQERLLELRRQVSSAGYHTPHLLRHFDRRSAAYEDCKLEFPSGKIDLEIGCGVGWHSLTYALKHPNRRIVAIEHTRERYDSMMRRYDAHGRPNNLIPVHADAKRWLASAPDDLQLDRVFLLYPNPYPKRRHHRRRWHNQPFLGFVCHKLAPGGTLHIATNIEDYARQAADTIPSTWDLQLCGMSLLHGHADKARTHFEKKYLRRGQSCYDLVFSKLG